MLISCSTVRQLLLFEKRATLVWLPPATKSGRRPLVSACPRLLLLLLTLLTRLKPISRQTEFDGRANRPSEQTGRNQATQPIIGWRRLTRIGQLWTSQYNMSNNNNKLVSPILCWSDCHCFFCRLRRGSFEFQCHSRQAADAIDTNSISLIPSPVAGWLAGRLSLSDQCRSPCGLRRRKKKTHGERYGKRSSPELIPCERKYLKTRPSFEGAAPIATAGCAKGKEHVNLV